MGLSVRTRPIIRMCWISNRPSSVGLYEMGQYLEHLQSCHKIPEISNISGFKFLDLRFAIHNSVFIKGLGKSVGAK